MKKLGMVAAVLVMAGAASGWAQTNAFIISIKGTITQKDGTRIQVKDVSKGVSGLVSTDSNDLVFIGSRDKDAFEIDEVSGGTNIVHAIAGTFRTALLDSGVLNGDLEANGTGHNGSVTSFPTNIPPFAGDVQFTGKVKGGTKPGVSGTLQGVWNDHRNGDTNNASATFKGSVKSTGTNQVPVNCCKDF